MHYYLLFKIQKNVLILYEIGTYPSLSYNFFLMFAMFDIYMTYTLS